MSYKIKDLSNENPTELVAMVRYFAESDLPNKAFLRQFYAPYEDSVSNKDLWEGYAQVLCLRGFPKVEDVKTEILIWWQDKNWPGFRTIEKFAIQEKESFVLPVKKTIMQAYREKDIIWFKNLLELLSQIDALISEKSRRFVENIVDYLSDDTWKDFDKLYYNKVLKLIS